MSYSDIPRFLGSIFLSLLAGFIGSLFAVPSLGWFGQLKMPLFTQPSWLVVFAFLVFYLLLGISLYLIRSQGTTKVEVKKALLLFTIQQLSGILWFVVLFGLRSLPLGSLVATIWWVYLLFTGRSFQRLMSTSKLLIPTYLWVGFVAVLNWTLFFLNR